MNRDVKDYLRNNVSNLMAAGSPERQQSAVLSNKASLCLSIWEAVWLSFALYPLDVSLRVDQLNETLSTIADHCDLEAVLAIGMANVRDLQPGCNEDAFRFEVIIVVEITLHALFGFKKYMRLVSFSVEYVTGFAGVDVCVERCD